MKPTDSQNTPDNQTPVLPDTPAVSRLNRVVDMSSINSSANASNDGARRSHSSGNASSNANKSPRIQRGARTHKQEETDASSPSAGSKSDHRSQRTAVRSSTRKPSRRTAEYEARTSRLQPPTPSANKPDSHSPALPPVTSLHPETKSSQNAAPAPVKTKQPRTGHIVHKGSFRIAQETGGKKDLSGIFEKAARNKKTNADTKTESDRQTAVKSPVSVPSSASSKVDDVLMLQSWRSKQWNASIISLSPTIEEQIPKSMPLVQAKLVNNICISCGSIESTVVDQITSISLRKFTPGQWRAVVNMLSDKAIFATSLLNGELPEGIIGIFKQASLSLFPTKIREFSFTCSCCPTTVPCEHAVALLLAFAQALEEDPFHILTLRGLNRDDLLSMLRDARSDQVVDEKSRHRINYEMPAQNIDFTEYYAPKGDFSEFTFHISSTYNPLLRRLGCPPPWKCQFPLESVISPIIDLASHEAEKLGLCETDDLSAMYPERPNTRFRSAERESESHAPRRKIHAVKYDHPNVAFIKTILPTDILQSLQGEPETIAEDILQWLKSRGASDIRTLARRTRLHKNTIEAFLTALSDAGIVRQEIEGDKVRYSANY